MYIIVAGGGSIGKEFVGKLAEVQEDIVVVERDRDKCDDIYAEYGIEVINGNATNVSVLESAGVDKADFVVATMASDAANLAVSVLAKSYGVENIMALMNDSSYSEAYATVGVTRMLNIVDRLVSEMVFEVEKPEVRRIAELGDGAVEIFIVTIPEEGKIAGKTISDIASSRDLPQESIIAGVFSEKDNEFTIPRGETVLPGDAEVFVITRPEFVKKTAKFLMQK